jgi:hypothetical protein
MVLNYVLSCSLLFSVNLLPFSESDELTHWVKFSLCDNWFDLLADFKHEVTLNVAY